MGDFWSQFFGQVWGLILFLVGMVGAYIALWFYLRMRRNRIQAEKKAAVMGYEPEKEKKAKVAPAKAKAKEAPATQWVEALAEPDISRLEDDGDDPLAELYAARAEEAKAELAKP